MILQQHRSSFRTGDFERPSSLRKVKPYRKTSIQYVVYVQFILSSSPIVHLSICQRTVENSLVIRLRTMQSCGDPMDACLPLFVQVLLAVGRKATTDDIGLECVGVQRSQECVQSVHTHPGFLSLQRVMFC